MVAVSQRFVREATLMVPDAGTVTEMKAFAVLGQNTYGAAAGNDDRVIALAGAVTIIEPYVATITARVKRAEQKAREAQDRYFEGDYNPEKEEPRRPELG